MRFQKCINEFRIFCVEPRKRNVRAVRTRFKLDPLLCQNLPDRVAECDERRRFLNAGPKKTRAIIRRETTDACNRQFKRRQRYLAQPLFQIREDRFGHFTDKMKGDMH